MVAVEWKVYGDDGSILLIPMTEADKDVIAQIIRKYNGLPEKFIGMVKISPITIQNILKGAKP